MKVPQRDARIEWIKLLAIYAVVFQHIIHATVLDAPKLLTHGAVPAFAFLSVFFAVRAGVRGGGFWEWLRSRLGRLYGLFLVWNVVYFCLRVASARSGAPNSFGGFSVADMFLRGYDNALWFIPFILLANMGGFVCGRLAGTRGRWAGWLAGLLAVGVAMGLAISKSFPEAAPESLFPLARKAVPAALLAVALGLVRSDLECLSWRSLEGRAVAGLMWVLSCGSLLVIGRIVFLPETLVGVTFIIACMSLLPRSLPPLNPEYSLLIFVSHSLFIQAIRKLGFHAGLNWDETSAPIQLAGFLAVLAATTGLYWLAQKSRLGGWMLFRRAAKPAGQAS